MANSKVFHCAPVSPTPRICFGVAFFEQLCNDKRLFVQYGNCNVLDIRIPVCMFNFGLLTYYRLLEVRHTKRRTSNTKPNRSTHKWDTTHNKTRGSTSGQDRSPRVVTSQQRICRPSVSLQASSESPTLTSSPPTRHK